MEVKVQKIDPRRRIEQIRLYRGDDGILVGNLLGESPILIWHKEGSCFVAAGPDFAQRLGDALDCAREASEALDETHCDEEWIADFKEREDALLAKSARRGVPVPYCTVRVHADGSLWGVVEPRVEQFTATAQQVYDWSAVPFRLPAGSSHVEWGRAVLDAYARADAWCVANGVNGVTGMPRPLVQDAGGGIAVRLTPPAYWAPDLEEGAAPVPGVLRAYVHGDLVRGLVDGRMSWRVLPVGAPGPADGWEGAHGVAEVSSRVAGEAGCFRGRGVVRSRRWLTAWHEAPVGDGRLLVLRLDVDAPARRKSMAGKAERLLDRCARHTSITSTEE